MQQLMTAMAHDLNPHPDEGELEKYSMADPLDQEAAGFEEHLLNCEHCQQRLAETDIYVSSMRRAARQLRTQQRRNGQEAEGRRWNWLLLVPGLAMAALLIIAIGWWFGK